MATSMIPWRTRIPNVFDEFRSEVDTLMNRFFTDEAEAPRAYSPRTDIAETEKSYEIRMDIPGVKPADVNVEFKNGDLWITGSREDETQCQGKAYRCVERQWGEFQRLIRLGNDVDADHVEAEFKNGVLRVTVPKTETARTKHIEVKG